MATFGPKAWFYPFGKMSIFMGLTHGFGPKMGLFPTFFWQYSIGKCPFDILERKNTLRGYKKKSSKSQKIDIFPTFFF